MTHNEVILKTIELNNKATEEEYKKIKKLHEVKNELIKSYKIACNSCKQESYLKDLNFVQYYNVDMDSDRHLCDIKYCDIQCKCGFKNDIPLKIIEHLDSMHPTFSAKPVFNKVIKLHR